MAEPWEKRHRSYTSIHSEKFIDNTSLSKTSFLVSTEDNLIGERNPRWRGQVSAHVSATTPATGQWRSLSPGRVYASLDRFTRPTGSHPWVHDVVRSVVGTEWRLNSALPVDPITVPPVDTIDSIARGRLYGMASSQTSQASGLVALAELRKTVGAIKHPFREFRQLLEKREKLLKKRHSRFFHADTARRGRAYEQIKRDALSAVGGSWLELMFGVKPLVSDIFDLAQYLNTRLFQTGTEYYRIKGKAISKGTQDFVQTLEIVDPGNRVEFKFRCDKKISHRYKGEVKVDPLTDRWTGRDMSRLGFNLNQFVPTLLEITPWSFLLDYFSNLGDVIEAYSVPTASIVWINKTRRYERAYKHTGYSVFVNPAKPVSGGLNYYFAERLVELYSPATCMNVTWERSSVNPSALPRPEISFDLPKPLQFANMIALCMTQSRNRFSTL